MGDIRIFQSYFDEASKARLLPQFIPYCNTRLSKYLESQILCDLTAQGKHEGSAYFGLVSWRIQDKLPGVPNFVEAIEKLGRRHDFYVPNFRHPIEVWQSARKSHGERMVHVARRILRQLGFAVADIYNFGGIQATSNYQICRTELYLEFIERLLRPAITMMENDRDKTFQQILHEDSCYRLSANMTTARQQMIFGRNYYTLHPFIAERLFAHYAAIQGWKGCLLACRDEEIADAFHAGSHRSSEPPAESSPLNLSPERYEHAAGKDRPSVLVLVPMKRNLPDRLRTKQYELLQALQDANPGLTLEIVCDERGDGDANVTTFETRADHLGPIRQSLIDDYLRPCHDFVLWIDADVIWYPPNLPSLLIELGEGQVAAPMVYLDRHGERFYDIAGFVSNGKWGNLHKPYWPGARRDDRGLRYVLEGVGCVYMVPAEVYRAGARHRSEPGFTEHLPVCRFARDMGYQVYAIDSIAAYHAFLPDYGEKSH